MDSYSVGSGVLVRWSRYEEMSRWKTLFLQAHFPLFGSYLSSTCSQSPGCAFCGRAAEWNYHQGACQCQSGWWGSLMAPVLCMQRHRGFAAAGGMSPSAPETKGLGVGGVLCTLCTTRVLHTQQGSFNFTRSWQKSVCYRNNTPRKKWHSQLQKQTRQSPLKSSSSLPHKQAVWMHSTSSGSSSNLGELCVITSAVRLNPDEGSWACVCHGAMCSAAAKTQDQLVYSFYTVQKCY